MDATLTASAMCRGARTALRHLTLKLATTFLKVKVVPRPFTICDPFAHHAIVQWEISSQSMNTAKSSSPDNDGFACVTRAMSRKKLMGDCC